MQPLCLFEYFSFITSLVFIFDQQEILVHITRLQCDFGLGVLEFERRAL
jgi:hypothetical protein